MRLGLSTRSGVTAATLAMAAAVTGCTPAMQAARDTVAAAFSAPAPLVVNREDVLARPFAQLRLDSAYGSAILILAQVLDGQQYWVATSAQVFVIEHGLVRRMTGLPNTLEGTRFVDTDPFAAGLLAVDPARTYHRTVDWMPGYRYGVRLASRFNRIGRERVDILGETHDLVRIDEHVTAGDAGFSTINRYWVSPTDGTVMKSQQQITEDFRAEFTILRPYRAEAGR